MRSCHKLLARHDSARLAAGRVRPVGDRVLSRSSCGVALAKRLADVGMPSSEPAPSEQPRSVARAATSAPRDDGCVEIGYSVVEGYRRVASPRNWWGPCWRAPFSFTEVQRVIAQNSLENHRVDSKFLNVADSFWDGAADEAGRAAIHLCDVRRRSELSGTTAYRGVSVGRSRGLFLS